MYEPGNWVARVSPTPLLMIVAWHDPITLTDLALGASPTKIATDVQAAVIGNFAAHFNLSGPVPVPIDPQGILVAALAGVAAQAVVTEFAAGVTNPTTMGALVQGATTEFYHFPSTQVACDKAVQAFFAPLR